MKKLKFDIQINAPRKKVWNTMLHPETYREWTNVSWPGSNFEGEWKEGKDLRFASAFDVIGPLQCQNCTRLNPFLIRYFEV